MWLDEAQPVPDTLDEIAACLQEVAPHGLLIRSVERVEERAPALQTQVMAAEYRISFVVTVPPDLPQRIENLMAQPMLPRRWRERSYDLRPLILQLKWDGQALGMILSAREGATGRPEEVLAALDLPLDGACIERVRLILEHESC